MLNLQDNQIGDIGVYYLTIALQKNKVYFTFEKNFSLI